MAINRYTTLTPSQFSPLSLEEIMLVPSMKRKQHDDLLAKQEFLRGELAKVDPHEKYFNEAVQERQRLNDQLLAQSEQLAKEGVTPNTQSQFLKMNRDYQDSTSPTGKLGMINQHKKDVAATEKEYRDLAIKMGIPPSISEHWIQQAMDNHMKKTPLYDENGRVIPFKIDKNLVEKVDINKDFSDEAAKLGFTTTGNDSIWSNIATSPDGRYTYVNKTGSGYESTKNIGNINALINYMNAKVNDPTSKEGQWIDYARLNKQSLLDSLQQQSGIYIKDLYKDSSLHEISNLTDNFAGSGNGSNTTPGGIVDTFDAPYDFDGTVGKAISTINNYEKGLKEGKSFTPEEESAYNIAKESYAAFEKIKDNPEMYNQNKDGVPIGEFYGKKLGVKNASLTFAKSEFDKAKNDFLSNFKVGTKEYNIAKAKLGEANQSFIQNEIASSRGAIAKTPALEKVEALYNQKVKNKKDTYFNYRNDVFSKNNAYTPGYTFVRTDEMNNKLEGIERTLGSMLSTPGTTDAQGIFTAVSVGGKKHRNLSTDDKETLSKVLNSGIDKMEFVQVLPNSSSGLPKIEFKVKGNKNMISEDIKESFWKNDPTIGGEEGEFNIEIDLNRFSNIGDKNYVGTTNILTQLIPIIRESNPIVADQMQRAIYEKGKGVGTKR